MAWGIRWLRGVVRCFSAPPLVGIGVVGLLWGVVWASIVPPLFTRESLAGAFSLLWWARGGTWRVVRGMRTDLRATCGRTRARKTRKPVCITQTDAPPCALGCGSVRARVRPLMYIIPALIISQQNLPVPVIRGSFRCTPMRYGCC